MVNFSTLTLIRTAWVLVILIFTNSSCKQRRGVALVKQEAVNESTFDWDSPVVESMKNPPLQVRIHLPIQFTQDAPEDPKKLWLSPYFVQGKPTRAFNYNRPLQCHLGRSKGGTLSNTISRPIFVQGVFNSKFSPTVRIYLIWNNDRDDSIQLDCTKQVPTGESDGHISYGEIRDLFSSLNGGAYAVFEEIMPTTVSGSAPPGFQDNTGPMGN